MSNPQSLPPPGSHPTTSRAESREQLATATWDLLVIGGGILGTSVAWHAAQSGLRVAMVDAGDFAGATSSASSKLVHGGLRYLQTGALKLVAENHHERRVLARDVAPHLVRPLPFYLPIYKGGPHSATKLGAGVFAYSALSAFGDGIGRITSPTKAAANNPALRTKNLKAAATYSDHQMNDSRMAIMTVRAAVNSGAVVLNHTKVTSLRLTRGRVTGAELHDQINGTEFGINARLVLNATGPWVDHLRQMENKKAEPSIRLSKGVHLVLKRKTPWTAALATPIDKHRITFALPWEDQLLLGTTDEKYEGDPADAHPTQTDIQQILQEAATSIHDEHLTPDLITYTFAGLRALPGGPNTTETTKRETIITEGPGGMLSIAGGKWTTYRHIGRTIINKITKLPNHPLNKKMEPQNNLPPRTPLPGLANPNAITHQLLNQKTETHIDPTTAHHLAHHYGTLAFHITHLTQQNPKLAQKIHPDSPEIWAQAIYARDHEWATTTDDILRRRTTITIRGLDTKQIHTQTQNLLNHQTPHT